MSERSPLDILLSTPGRNVEREPETAEIEIPRISQEKGEKFVMKIRALTYDQIAALRGQEDLDVQIVLAGTVAPDFKSKALAVHYGVLADGEDWGDHGVMPSQNVTALLVGGEITEVSREIQRLSGYFRQMTKVVKKN